MVYKTEQWDMLKAPSGETYDRASHSLKVIADALAGMIASGGGLFGQSPLPTLEHERGVFWFKQTGTGTKDASTAANADDAADDNITAYGTANRDDVFLYLQGTIDFNGAVGGLTGIAGAHIIGLGGIATRVSNSNAGATYVINIPLNANNCEVAGFYVLETTNTVEGIYVLADGVSVHNNICSGAMENGISITNAEWCGVYHNRIYQITNDGIECIGGSQWTSIFENELTDVADNAIHINGTARNWVYRNIINGDAGTTDVGLACSAGNFNMFADNWLGYCGTSLYTDTGTSNLWEDNHGTHETDWTTALDGTAQDMFGTAAAHKAPMNVTGVVRIYPDYNGMGAAHTVVITVNRKNDGTNSRQATSITKVGVQTDKCPVYEIRYTKTRTVHITIQRTAGGALTVPIGIEEAVI